jgi:2-oxo-4-hydroxy-4-carboxy-5-ureidoimidazoline decarboxylase
MIDVSESELREGLAASLHVRRWVDDVAAEAPFADFDALRRVAHDRATPLSPDEVDEAVSAHPRIGERSTRAGRDAAFSRAEQEAIDSDDGRLDKALLEGNATYEERFGRVFLIRAAGRSRAEIVDELQRRLTLDDETELAIVGEELRDIALLRLAQLFGGTE